MPILPKSKMIPAMLVRVNSDLIHEILEQNTVQPDQTLLLQVVNGYAVGIDTEKRTVTSVQLPARRQAAASLYEASVRAGEKIAARKKTAKKTKKVGKKAAPKKAAKTAKKAAPKKATRKAAKKTGVAIKVGSITEERVISALKEPGTAIEVGNRLGLDRRAGMQRHQVKQIIMKLVGAGTITGVGTGKDKYAVAIK